jgi:tetratricopeptide (TPR) repeat protein
MNHRCLILYLCIALFGVLSVGAIAEPPPPAAPAAPKADAAADQIRKQRDEAFWKYYPQIEEGNNLLKLKTVALLERRKAAPVEPYLKIMQDDLAKVGEDSLRGVCIRSALAFAHVAQFQDDREGAEIQMKLLQMKTWPAGSERVRDETIRDFLRFSRMPLYEHGYSLASSYQVFDQLFEEYISPGNPSPEVLPFGKYENTEQYCFDLVRRTRMQMRGHFLPLKRAGIYCGEIGEWAECERLLGWALEVAPDDVARVEINEMLSDYMLKVGKTAQAILYYRQGHPQPYSVDAKLRLVTLLRADKQRDAAQRILDELLAGTPAPETLDKVGLSLLEIKEYAAAVQCLERYPLKFDGDAGAYNNSVRVAFNLAAAYDNAGRPGDAIALLRRVTVDKRTGEGFHESDWNLCAAMLKRLTRPSR